jgi:hypothetical protein
VEEEEEEEEEVKNTTFFLLSLVLVPGQPTGQMYFVFCRLYPFCPQTTTTVVWLLPVVSLLLKNTRRCGLAFSYDGRGLVGPKKKKIVGLLVFNPL